MAYEYLRGERMRAAQRPLGRSAGFLMQSPQSAQPPAPSFGPSGPPLLPPDPGGAWAPHPPAPGPPAPSFPFSGGSPHLAGPSPNPGGLQGLLQGLMGGAGSLDLPALINNAQKWVGVLNQFSSILKQAGPLLQLVQGLGSSSHQPGDDDTLTELTGDGKETENKRKRRSTQAVRKRTGRRKRRRSAKPPSKRV